MVVRTPREMGERVIEFLRSLPAGLGRRGVVLIPREAVAHEIRRQVLERKDGAGLLAGVTFLKPGAFAVEVCARAGNPRRPVLEQTWPAVLDFLIQEDKVAGQLTYFKADKIKEHEGYPRAIANTLTELDRAGLDANALDEIATRQNNPGAAMRLSDLVVFRRAIDEELSSQTNRYGTARSLMRQAADLLDARASLRTGFGPLAAILTGPREAELQPLAKRLAIPPIRLIGLPDSPIQSRFELSLHGGAEDELEAATTWVEREIVEHRIPMGQIAVLTAQRQLSLPMARKIEQRLGANSVFLPGGRPLSSTTAGAQAGLTLRVVLNKLPRKEIADLIAGTSTELAPGEAIDAIAKLGVLGGRSDSPQLWLDKIHTQPCHPWVRTVIDTLAHLAMAVDSEERLETIKKGVGSVLMLLGDSKEREALLQTLDESWMSLAPASHLLSGQRGLKFLADSMLSMTVAQGRYGMPQIFVGPPEAAVGLTFRAVRLAGLVEGSIPPNPGEDPVLPDSDRRTIRDQLPEGKRDLLPLRTRFADERRIAADTCMCGHIEHLSASAALQQVDTRQLEPSAYLFELVARATSSVGTLPSAGKLRELSRKSLIGLHNWQKTHPLGLVRQMLEIRKTPGSWRVPPEWLGSRPNSLEAIRKTEQARGGSTLGSANGIVAKTDDAKIPGLLPTSGLSLTRLKTLLRCPYRFALEVVLGLEEPGDFPSSWRLDPMSLGNVLHRLAERFFNEHGEAFLQTGDPSPFRKIVEETSKQILDEFLLGYALEGETTRELQLREIYDLAMRMLAYYARTDWDHFEKAEYPVGSPSVAISTPDGDLHLRGRVDLILSGKRGKAVHDLKSGSAHPFSGYVDLDMDKDLQPLVYDACLAATGESPVTEVGLVYPSGGSAGLDRLLSGAVLTRSREWTRRCLAVARQLIRSGAFAPLPDRSACEYCSFLDHCDQSFRDQALRKVEALNRSGDKLTDAERALLALKDLRVFEVSGNE